MTEEMKENLENPNPNAVHSDSEKLPEPVIANYNQKFRLTDAFLHDLEVSLKDVPLGTSLKFIKFAETKKDLILYAELNEFVNKLQLFPYAIIRPLMRNIEGKDTQHLYFEEIVPPQPAAEQPSQEPNSQEKKEEAAEVNKETDGGNN